MRGRDERGSLGLVPDERQDAPAIEDLATAKVGFDPVDPPRVTRTTQVVYPHHLNHQGNLFGGEALQMMDTAAFVAATRLTRKRMVTLAVNDVRYISPVRHGEIVEIVAVVDKVGTTSVTVDVTMIGEVLLSGERRICGHGEIVMVALDEHDQPTPIEG